MKLLSFTIMSLAIAFMILVMTVPLRDGFILLGIPFTDVLFITGILVSLIILFSGIAVYVHSYYKSLGYGSDATLSKIVPFLSGIALCILSIILIYAMNPANMPVITQMHT